MLHIHIETDSMNLVRAMQASYFDLAPEGVIYRDLRVFLRLHFSSVIISHVSRNLKETFLGKSWPIHALIILAVHSDDVAVRGPFFFQIP
jgi:hypothetical protein